MNWLAILQNLFPYLVLFYLADCFLWVKARFTIFVSQGVGKFHLRRSRDIQLIGLLPTERVFLSHRRPIIFTELGIFVVTDEKLYEQPLLLADDFHFFSYESLQHLRSDRKNVLLNERLLVKLSTARSARIFVEQVASIRCMAVKERPAKIAKLSESRLNVEGIRQCLGQFPGLFTLTATLSFLLFIQLYIILPLILYFYVDYAFHLKSLLLAIGINFLIVIFASVILDGKLFPEKKMHRVKFLISLLFSPVSTTHVLNLFTRELLAQYDELAIAAVLLPAKQLSSYMGGELIQVQEILEKSENEAFRNWWQDRGEAIQKIAVERQLNLHATPERRDESAASFCPLCETEYREGFKRCSECDISLEAY